MCRNRNILAPEKVKLAMAGMQYKIMRHEKTF